ncbi:hypothetical protein O181_045435 [Austropuccinia psidii MF-1]|uniref:Nucleolar protein 14 n=1 Tax=Austropuccinia psidii MF-1 TaxID=1389203 RepID=A0A9Q3HL75_9BASI|nr:hypothetical protein [Austropuccinia psidii MF-1]
MGRSSMTKKPSQLAQLKKSLSATGLSRVSTSAKSTTNRKNKSSITGGVKDPELRHKQLAEIHASQNLFDLKTSKVKFPTSNQLQRQDPSLSKLPLKNIKRVGKPTQSATQAYQRRVEKLLPEYQNRHKSSQFLDKRFGEGDFTLTPEEKALERFTKERQSRLASGKKRKIFNLDEGEDLYSDGEFGSNIQLTHGGLDLDFESDDSNDKSDAKDDFDGDFLKPTDSSRTPGHHQDILGDELSQKPKTKAEIMSEVISKSKAYKYQRQLIREKDDELRCDLNDQLNEIRSLLFDSQLPLSSNSKKQQTKDTDSTTFNSNVSDCNVSVPIASKDSKLTEQKPLQTTFTQGKTKLSEKDPEDLASSKVDRNLLASLIGSSSRSSSEETEDNDNNAYDRYVRELAFEGRAKPSDRLKTAEETALEEAERLQELERQRLRRMNGMDDDDDDGTGQSSLKKSARGSKKRKPQADDLDDDFLQDNEAQSQWNVGEGLKAEGAFGAGVAIEETNQGTSSEIGESSVDNDDISQTESSLSLDSEMDNQDAETSHIQSLISSVSTRLKKKKSNLSKNELAYTFPCPSCHADFLEILASTSAKADDLPTIVQRIRVLYHPSLGKDNTEKLASFLNVLIDHIIYITSSPSLPEFSVDIIHKLLPHIIALCQAYAQASSSHFITKLGLMQKNLSYALTNPTSNGWPGVSELIFLRLIGLLWSTSDFSHPVVAPALLLMSQYLNQLRVKQFTDLISGLFLCTLALQYETYSKRLMPEVVNFLTLAFLRITSSKIEITKISCMIPILEGPDLVTFPMKRSESTKLSPQPLDFLDIFNKANSETLFQVPDQELVNTLDILLSLLCNFSNLYASANFYPEVFSSVLSVVETVENTLAFSQEITSRLSELKTSITSGLAVTQRLRKLNPLKLQAHRPIPIPSQTPQFESNFNPNQKKFNPDSAQVEFNKLKGLIKKEKKGAIRELRKDNKFLAIEKAKEKEQTDAEYKTKMARITAGLQLERSEEKKQERTKQRLKKLDKVRSTKK